MRSQNLREIEMGQSLGTDQQHEVVEMRMDRMDTSECVIEIERQIPRTSSE